MLLINSRHRVCTESPLQHLPQHHNYPSILNSSICFRGVPSIISPDFDHGGVLRPNFGSGSDLPLVVMVRPSLPPLPLNLGIGGEFPDEVTNLLVDPCIVENSWDG